MKNAVELPPYQSIKDQISRQSWRVCCFSGDGEYICAGQVKQNNLLFYETAVRSENLLVKTLTTKGNDSFTDVVWHPSRPVLCCISAGEVAIYTHNYIENWSAYAPDFEELEENRPHMEKENEFDDSDEDKSASDDEDDRDDTEVDVCKFDRVAAYCSSDEEEVDDSFLEYIPLSIEQIEMGAYSNLSGYLTGIGGQTIEKEMNKKTDEIVNVKNGGLKPVLGTAGKRSAQNAKMAAKILAKRATSSGATDNSGNKDRSLAAENRDSEAAADNGEVGSKPAEIEKLDSIELNFGSDANLIHPLLIPSSKLRNAMKRRQDKLALGHEGESRLKRSKH